MDGFVDIVSFFSSPDDRTIDKLSLIYNDREALVEKIKLITERHLTIETFKGKRILLKPNWVKHSSNEDDEICLRTNDQFLLAALKVILQKEPASVIIGDAPIQGCNWDKMITSEFLYSVNLLSEQFNIPVTIKDFRRVTFNPKLNNPVTEKNPLSDYVIFDLGKESLLESISDDNRRLFRVTDYNPDRLAISHCPGVHKYCITRELFDNDVVITIPKVKTHQKTGLTNALKILVGINGDKDFLPHHRKGGTGKGGDCYPGNNVLRNWSEIAIDHANRHQGKLQYKLWRKLSSLFWHLSFPSQEQNRAAAWHGNDTTWRMVLDLNKIAEYGLADGTIANTPQRVLFSLSDGIIGGQGDGPLRPEPLPLGIACFSNHASFTDITMGILMEIEFTEIPLLNAAWTFTKNDSVTILLNNYPVSLSELKKISIKTILSPGWLNYSTKK
jgi:uncharacterized protein (DUF362 family)